MMMPASLDELSDAVRAAPRVLAVGARTKPRLSEVEAVRISTLGLQGITEYEPSEFTFTALAGTPVREVAEELAGRGQHLPFDPMLAAQGATLGGVVASGLSGPGRFRFGGIRDFILGVRFVDGAGRRLRMGGKVVKNAAGFDLPKFFTGSLGRFGVLGEITFKVFPRPAGTLTLRLRADSIGSAADLLMRSARSRWEPEALDILPGGFDVLLRLGGPLAAVEAIAREILGFHEGRVLPAAEAACLWEDLGGFEWAHPDENVIKVPLAPGKLVELFRALEVIGGVRIHGSAGGNVAWVAVPMGGVSAVDAALRGLGLSGLTLRGGGPLWSGRGTHSVLAAAVKRALDPENRFPSLDD